MLQWLKAFFSDEFLVVSLPRVLVLQNRRLGMFYKLLQLAFMMIAVSYGVHEHLFMLHHDVQDWSVNLWHETHRATQPITDGTLPSFCKDTAAYMSKDDAVFQYKPTSCKAWSNNELRSVDGGKLFVPTFVDATKVWNGRGDECGAVSQKVCSELSAESIYEDADGQCTCTSGEQFLVPSAGEQYIRFVYGYEVDTSSGKRQDLHRGGILSSSVFSGPESRPQQQATTLVTQFRAHDGAACAFGGKTEWLQSEAVGGISGTLNELLACAGVTLDTDPATLVAGTVLAPPHLRTMGFKLVLHLFLSQDYFGDLKCDVKVVATPITTMAYHSDVISSAFPPRRMGAVAHRLQRVHGVSIDVRLKGRIYTFSWYQVVRGAVDILVVLQVPRIIVYFVAMYMLDLISKVYRGTARTKLNVFRKFHSSIAKLLLAEVAFRGLINNFTDRMPELGTVTPQLLLQRLVDIFHGKLNEEEIVKLAAVVFKSMDRDNSDEICCSEFIQSSTDEGELNLAMMTSFFEAKASDRSSFFGRLRGVLDDTEKRSSIVISRSLSRLFNSQSTDELSVSKILSWDSTVSKLRSLKFEASDMFIGIEYNQKPPDQEQHVGGNLPNDEKDNADLNRWREELARHEKEIQKLLDHHKQTAETLTRRVQELELLILQALGVLKESLHRAPVQGSRQRRGGGAANALSDAASLTELPTPPPPLSMLIAATDRRNGSSCSSNWTNSTQQQHEHQIQQMLEKIMHTGTVST